jgi:hypothetical protein
MITGLAGFAIGCFGPLPGIAALVMGFVALSQIKKSPEQFGGKPYATAGIIVGSISVFFYLVFILWIILNGVLR